MKCDFIDVPFVSGEYSHAALSFSNINEENLHYDESIEMYEWNNYIVSANFADQVKNYVIVEDKEVELNNANDLANLDNTVTEIKVNDDCLNDIVEVNFSGYPHLRKIEIGKNCFKICDKIVIEDCPFLRRIEIAEDSFTKIANWRDFDTEEEREALCNNDRSLIIRRCQLLKSIVINNGSFVDYAGKCEFSRI